MYNYINPSLPVLEKVPPDGFEVDVHGSIMDWDKLITANKDKWDTYYYCTECKGYIKGSPSEHGENTIGPLAGRFGQSYNCIRCNYELAFYGYVS